MQRIGTLLKKIHELYNLGDKATALEIDLMMDYTRVMYADLLEWRNRIGFNESLLQSTEPSVSIKKTEEKVPEKVNTVPEVTSQPIELAVTSSDEPDQKQGNISTDYDTPRLDIRKYISINDKYLYTSELFAGNSEAYENALTEINEKHSYDEALEWLDENVNFEYSWEEDDEIVQSFYYLLNQFFASR